VRKFREDLGGAGFDGAFDVCDVGFVVDGYMGDFGVEEFLGQIRRGGGEDVEEDHLRALVSEGFYHRGANAGCASGDNHDTVFETGVDGVLCLTGHLLRIVEGSANNKSLAKEKANLSEQFSSYLRGSIDTELI
jgi:hypothetical protein